MLMMLQMPIVMVQRMPWIRERKLLNNIMFWISMIIGLSLVSVVLDYLVKLSADIR